MSRDPAGGRAGPTHDPDAGAGAFEEGRYLYCLVGGEDDGLREGALGVVGVDGSEPRLVAADGVGAVVHDCATVYEDDDPDQVKRWLVAHQSVVDAAAERFGTPLPFGFDVVVEGDDDAVREWIRDAEGIREHLRTFAGRREYRVQLRWADGAEAHLRDRDDRLSELADEADAAAEGRSYLVERQYENRLGEVRSERAAALAETLHGAVKDVVHEAIDLDPDNPLTDDEPAPLARVAVLADEADEDALGERLDEVAAEPDVVVEFTGPWPPYSFAPELG